MILATFHRQDGALALGLVQREAGLIIDAQVAAQRLDGRPEPRFQSMLSLIDGGPAALDRLRELGRRAMAEGLACLPLSSVRLAAPVPQPPQMRDFSVFETHMRNAAVGMARLRRHRQQADWPLPVPEQIQIPEAFVQQPVYYKTNRFSVVGHEHEVQWPRYSQRLDYELEFGIFLARRGRDISRSQARDYIFGYTIFNDFSARDAQEFEMTAPFGPTKGKDFDTGNVLGPWIVTPDELPDPYALRMSARVNGELWSDCSSAGMVHQFEDMIAHVSRDETLHAGEFFGSGTAGGGCGLELDRWIQPGDVIELEVEGIGKLRNRVVRSP
ncbi:fumarylacetoacetate hydrolase family protein [Uliginosibacterium sediminicola]|uniref:Fumarylacetoacetate hydrolase family protein n=1 Tax=Uliginosibacterium sediminicola TaxID=2024550 RepID=A0ABU9YXM7_9RHOO